MYTEQQMTIKQRFDQLERIRNPYTRRCELYAKWTLPWIFPDKSIVGNEQNDVIPSSYGSIGARCVNHLANRLVDVLFPANRPFYRADLGERTVQVAEQAGLDKSQLNNMVAVIERNSLKTTNVANHRAKANYAAKLLAITGNALVYYLPRRKETESRDVVVYNLRNFVWERAYNGRVQEIITRDFKHFGGFSESVKESLRASGNTYQHDTQVELYTRIWFNPASDMYEVTQAADNVDVVNGDGRITVYHPNVLPWIPLTWNIVDGEHYGRGIVEDYQLDFNAYDAFTTAQTRIVSIMSDIKRFVRLSSAIDVEALDSAPPGTTFAGEPGDLWYAEMSGKQFDIAALTQKITDYEQRLSSAFMLTSASVRQAERVTAEEIRMQINELETSLGGIYSKLATDWQLPLANLLLFDAGIQPGLDITPLIITGMDAMSRNAESEAIYLVFQDLQVIDGLGSMGRYVDQGKWVDLSCANRGVERDKIFLTDEQVQQNDMQQQQAMMQQQQAMQDLEIEKAAMKE